MNKFLSNIFYLFYNRLPWRFQNGTGTQHAYNFINRLCLFNSKLDDFGRCECM